MAQLLKEIYFRGMEKLNGKPTYFYTTNLSTEGGESKYHFREDTSFAETILNSHDGKIQNSLSLSQVPTGRIPLTAEKINAIALDLEMKMPGLDVIIFSGGVESEAA